MTPACYIVMYLSYFRLCKLFTNSITEVKDLAADFLFVLCKENGMLMASVACISAALLFVLCDNYIKSEVQQSIATGLQ